MNDRPWSQLGVFLRAWTLRKLLLQDIFPPRENLPDYFQQFCYLFPRSFVKTHKSACANPGVRLKSTVYRASSTVHPIRHFCARPGSHSELSWLTGLDDKPAGFPAECIKTVLDAPMGLRPLWQGSPAGVQSRAGARCLSGDNND
jgi:hypothetical protein